MADVGYEADEPLVDDSLDTEIEGRGTSPEDGGEDYPSLTSPSPPQDPYHERFSRIERENSELRISLQRLAQGQGQPQGGVPQALSKPQEAWTVRDWAEFNQWMVQSHLEKATAEHATRGRLSAEVLGPQHSYDAIIEKYVQPLAQRNPEIQPFLQQLPAEDRYMIGLMHLIHERSGGDLVRTIRSITNALDARQAGARDVVRSIQSGTRTAARKVFSGSGGRPAGRRPLSSQDVWDMSDEDFRRLEGKATGR